MALSYGLTNPAAFKGQIEEYPDLFKMYTVVPTRSTESTDANKRRPVLYTSLNGGIGWNFESQSSGFYNINYGGNFLFRGNDGTLTGFAHKSVSSSYSAYKARCGLDDNHRIRLDVQNWEASSAVSYSTANQPDRQICRNLSSSRFFCIRNGGGFVYTNTAWGSANWTLLTLPSGVKLTDDGGFRHICINPENEHEALVLLATDDTNKYLRSYLFDTSTNTFGTNYTTIIWGGTNSKQSNYKYASLGYLPGVGYLIFYAYNNDNNFCVRILRTHDTITGEKLPSNQYINTDTAQNIGNSNNKIVQYGSHGWYCPWTKEYYFVPNAYQVFWTKDGINWNSSVATSASSTTACQKFLTDGTNMIIATSGSTYYRSYDKGQTWASGTSLSPNGFNTGRSNDTIVLPFKCNNNLGIDMSSAVLGEYYTSTGTVGTSINNFRLNDYISIDPSTSYVFFGKVINSSLVSTNVPIVRNSRISFYDSNKTFISQVESNSWVNKGSGNYTPCIATSPSNAAYVRLCCRIDDAEITMEKINACKWYFAKESDFQVMTDYGDIVCD